MPINTLASVRSLVGFSSWRFCRNMLILKEKGTAIRTLRGLPGSMAANRALLDQHHGRAESGLRRTLGDRSRWWQSLLMITTLQLSNRSILHY
jgi:hypothetical protein